MTDEITCKKKKKQDMKTFILQQISSVVQKACLPNLREITATASLLLE